MYMISLFKAVQVNTHSYKLREISKETTKTEWKALFGAPGCAGGVARTAQVGGPRPRDTRSDNKHHLGFTVDALCNEMPTNKNNTSQRSNIKVMTHSKGLLSLN